jgi:fructosamine-3-kinase
MSDASLAQILAAVAEKKPGLQPRAVLPVSGGCIHRCFVLEGAADTPPERWFLKVNAATLLPLLQAESAGLDVLRAALNPDNQPGLAAVPELLLCERTGQHAFLLMEYLPLTRRQSGQDEEKLAQALVRLHATISPNGQYGFATDNFIGRTPQPNTWESDWPTFFARQRLAYQLDLAKTHGYSDEFIEVQQMGRELIGKLPDFFTDHKPQPSLLHGDLWSGNTSFLPDGRPALFDPAVYYGDRETDLAMMELFGGFSPLLFSFYRFYAARAGNPLAPETDPAFQRRRRIYQLYHWLNHLNLFGRSYLPQVKKCLEEIRA